MARNGCAATHRPRCARDVGSRERIRVGAARGSAAAALRVPRSEYRRQLGREAPRPAEGKAAAVYAVADSDSLEEDVWEAGSDSLEEDVWEAMLSESDRSAAVH